MLPELLHLLYLFLEILESKFVFSESNLEFPGLLVVEDLLGLLDQGDHIPHPEYSRSHPLGIENFEGVELLSDTDELDRLARDRPHRKGSPTSRVAVELGEDHAVEATFSSKAFAMFTAS